MEELLRAIELIPFLDGEKLLACLDAYDKVFLYQKTGYILEHYKSGLKLSNDFFAACQSKITKSKRYLYSGLQGESSVLNKDWMLFTPKNLLAETRKGANFVE